MGRRWVGLPLCSAFALSVLLLAASGASGAPAASATSATSATSSVPATSKSRNTPNASNDTSTRADSAPPEWVEMRNNSTMFWRQYSRNVEAIEAFDRDGTRPDVLVYGDSITAWSSGFDLSSIPATRDVFDRHFGDLQAEPLGIPGDEIKHLYWRLLNGESPKRSPKHIVLFIGINDVVHGVPVDELVSRMDQLLAFVKTSKRMKESNVIVQKLLPSHSKVAEINEAYVRLAKRHGATVSDCLSGQLDRSDREDWRVWMADQLHPSLRGQDALLGCWRRLVDGRSSCRLPRSFKGGGGGDGAVCRGGARVPRK